MDRRAVFTPAFQEFLESQKAVTCQVREQRRYPQGQPGEFRFAVTEWRDVTEPTYREEIIPSTLTEEDVQKDRWPSTCYRFHLANGQIIESFVQKRRDFMAQNMTVDFMGIRKVRIKAGTGTKDKPAEYEPSENVDELCWGDADVNEYLPMAGNSGRGRRVLALEVTEPQPIG